MPNISQILRSIASKQGVSLEIVQKDYALSKQALEFLEQVRRLDESTAGTAIEHVA